MWIALALLVVAAVLGVAQLAVLGWVPTVPAAEDLGEVGAAYGAAGTIISGFAFIAVVVPLVGQKRQLLKQQEELVEQKAELKEQKRLLTEQTKALTETSDAQRDAAGSLQGQLSHMLARARLDDYDRRLGRFIEAQAQLDETQLDVELGSSISHVRARDRLGPRYLTALTNLLRGLDRLKGIPNLEPSAEELARELRTSLEREHTLLYLAVVPSWVPPEDYTPSELGRLMAGHGLFPYIPEEEFMSAQGRPAIYREHFVGKRSKAA